jgi:hypothetical protein
MNDFLEFFEQRRTRMRKRLATLLEVSDESSISVTSTRSE